MTLSMRFPGNGKKRDSVPTPTTPSRPQTAPQPPTAGESVGYSQLTLTSPTASNLCDIYFMRYKLGYNLFLNCHIKKNIQVNSL